MLVLITVENGVKKVIPLTADAGAGNPVGTLIHTYKKSNPSGYLFCDGSTFDQTKYPLLYAYLGSNVLPDYRECVEVGAEQNATDSIATHDVYTEGQFKDDQLQDHEHEGKTSEGTGGSNVAKIIGTSGTPYGGSGLVYENYRHGTTTHGKQKAVFVYIKATSGLSENAQDNVINTLNEQRSYSTTPHKTGEKWIDGKDIWKVTLPISSPISGSTTSWGGLQATISNLGISTPIKSWGVSSTRTVSLSLDLTEGFINADMGIATGYVVLEYTKTN